MFHMYFWLICGFVIYLEMFASSYLLVKKLQKV